MDECTKEFQVREFCPHPACFDTLHRPCLDDGVSIGLTLPSLIAVALLLSAQRKAAIPGSELLPRGWLIEAPRICANRPQPLSALSALVLSRRSLVDYATLCSLILVVQILASSWYEARHRRHRNVPEGERGSVPRSESLRVWLYSIFSLGLALILVSVKFLFVWSHVNIWKSKWTLDQPYGFGSSSVLLSRHQLL